MTERSSNITKVEQLAHFLSATHTVEFQGVAIHRSSRRIAMAYAGVGFFASLLIFKWPIASSIFVVFIALSLFDEYRGGKGWVQNLALRESGENLICWNNCRYFSEEKDQVPELIIGIPWNLTPHKKKMGNWHLKFAIAVPVIAALPFLSEILDLYAIRLIVPLMLWGIFALLYKRPKKEQPDLHPFTFEVLQSLLKVLPKEMPYAIVLLDGSVNGDAIRSFLLNFEPLIGKKSPFILIQHDSGEMSYSPTKNSHSLQTSETLPKTAKAGLAKTASLLGWNACRIYGEIETTALLPTLKDWANSEAQPLPEIPDSATS